MKKLVSLICLFLVTVSFTSCDEESVDVDSVTKQTIFVYMPWSGSDYSSGLYDYFIENLDSMYAGIKQNKGLGKSRMVVFLSKSASSSVMYEVTYTNGQCVEKPLKQYDAINNTTAEGISAILNDLKNFAPALNYAMIIGCHGTGWTYKDSWEAYPYYAKRHLKAKNAQTAEYEMTRFYGSISDITKYATDIETLAAGIRGANMKMQYILFDDCYMSNAEVAYELRDVTNFMIASTSEVMAIGMPYKDMWSSLATPTPNYSGAVNAFYNFYKNYRSPYGAIAAVDCRKMDELAQIMREINQKHTLSESSLGEIQVLDGFQKTIFFDLGDYVDKLCGDDRKSYSTFSSVLNSVVNSKAVTEKIYSYLYNEPVYVDVNTFSGLTISDPSIHPVALKGKKRTPWWDATH